MLSVLLIIRALVRQISLLSMAELTTGARTALRSMALLTLKQQRAQAMQTLSLILMRQMQQKLALRLRL